MLVRLHISRACCCPLSPLRHARPAPVSMTTRPAVGAADASVGVRKILQVCSRRVLVVVPREERLIGRRAIGVAGTGSTAWREEKGQEASGGLRTYVEALVIYERRTFSRAGVTVRVDSVVGRQIAQPCLAPRFRVEAAAQYNDLASPVPTCRHDEAVAVECLWLVEWIAHWRCGIVERAVGGKDWRYK